ncbi:putative sensor domain DACNV-containing protein [Catalinimonas niigatensis]|uniref:putative sensor domain DACNV-containing protein n=1 Tax=Catalinimonas niigatensis TaxID=1397264 RepID=UPI002666D06B|nr:hypothetical protein [Catalinimonas niigatensis]WPP51703.1 hypothetical protein PZB72_04785 [Catalinimonas niigatensis]
MTSQSTYQAARAVAAKVENHFAQQISAARARGEQSLAPEPSAQIIERMLDVAFWASLRREEGRPPKISLAFLPPDQGQQQLLFQQRLEFTTTTLTKLAPGVERPGIHLGVWYEGDVLYVWGTTFVVPNFCFVLDVSEPGLLVVKYRRRHGFGKFVNVAVLIGDQVKVVDDQNTSLSNCPELITSLLGLHPSSLSDELHENDSVNVLIQLAVSMRNHQQGGALLVVPSNSQIWRDSIIHPIKYAVTPAFTGLADLMRERVSKSNQDQWQSALRSKIESMAGLTAIDGATVINDQYELLAFGAKIKQRPDNPTVERILMTEPVIDWKATIIHPAQSGGTRHLSAAQFIHDQPDALALVASQDGRFTVFSWSHQEEIVQSHRIESLLL